MKKIIFSISIAALVLGAASCKKGPETPVTGQFTATIEKALDTKTVLTEDLKVNWEKTDQINVNGATYDVAPDGDDATKATLTKVAGEDPETPFVAIYPASCYDNGQFKLSNSLTFTADKFSNIPMWAGSTTKDLSFRNVFAVLKVIVDEKEWVKKVVVTSDLYINGVFTVASNTAIMADGRDENKVTTLQCDDAIKGNIFYIPLPAGDYSGKHLKVQVYSNDVNKDTMKTLEDATIIMKPGVIYSLNFISGATFMLSKDTIQYPKDIL